VVHAMTLLHAAAMQGGLLLDPGEITLSLLKRHGATNFQEVFEHLGLTVGAGFGAFGEEGLYFGGDGGGVGKQLLKLFVLLCNVFAAFAAPRQVGFVQLGDASELS